MKKQPIYLDNNATTRLAPEALEAMAPYLEHCYGNPSSTHRLGVEAREALVGARAAVAGLLGAKPSEIVFTSGCTESNHLAILGAVALTGKRHIVSSTVEHPATLMLLRDLERQGFRVTFLPVDGDGRLDSGQFERAIGSDTALVTLMWANNETGILFPISRLAAIARSREILFHTDAAQAAGRVPIDVSTTPVDLISFSGHKLHAPKGVGGLFVREGLKWPGLLRGHQERRRRGGTENVPALVALGAACRLVCERIEPDNITIAGLRDRFEDGILSSLKPWVSVNGRNSERLPNTTNICFGTVDAEAILTRLDREGIFASSGAACSSGGIEPSHVLTAMGLGHASASSSIRFSLSRYTTEAEVDRVLDTLPAILRGLVAESSVAAAF